MIGWLLCTVRLLWKVIFSVGRSVTESWFSSAGKGSRSDRAKLGLPLAGRRDSRYALWAVGREDHR
jgi:hypothetical protein